MLFDRNRLTIKKLDERKSKTSYNPAGMIKAIERRDQLAFADELADEIEKKKKVVIGFGAHFIKNKCHRHLIELMNDDYIAHVITNGASTIHDFEFGYHGKTEEDVRENLANGTFGLWETGEHVNKAVNTYTDLGYGTAMGRYIDEERDKTSIWPAGCVSLAWHCYKKNVPLSICTSIGHDIIYQHPECDGAKIGEASYIDFLKLAHTMEGIEDAVFICVGSAITVPMVIEKAYAMAKNVARETGNNCSCYIVDLFSDDGEWSEGEPLPDSSSYYNRPMKTFNRMFPGRCKYMQLDNRQLMYHLRNELWV